jgi:antitoxin YefM
MQSVYRLNANELDADFVESLKVLWHDREIEITISEITASDVDETAYLMGNPANRRRLLKAVDDIEKRQNLVEVQLEELA